MKFDYQKLYINGELADAQTNERHEVICPATDEVLSEVAKASPADAQIALEAAKEAFIGWSVLPLEERIAWLHKMRDAIAKNRKIQFNRRSHFLITLKPNTLEIPPFF